MTGNPVSGAARAAARRLASTHGAALETQVEAALYARSTDRQPDQYFDPITLGSLVVSVATLTWTIYKDLHKMRSKPTREAVIDRLLIELRSNDSNSPVNRDDVHDAGKVAEVIEIVVDEVLKADGEDEE